MKNTLVAAIAIVLVSLTASCACWKDKAQTPACVVVHQMIDCTTGAVKDIIPGLLPFLNALISSGNPDWDLLLAKLEKMGFKDAGCILAALEEDFTSNQKMSISPDIASKVSVFESKWTGYRQSKYQGIKFKIMTADGKVVVK